MASIVRLLYELTSALLVPVIILLFLLLAWVLFESGGFVREWLRRRHMYPLWHHFLQSHDGSSTGAAAARDNFFASHRYPSLIATFAQRGRTHKSDREALERIINEIEVQASEHCSRLNLWIRIGPMLGLMGTLIPMGPALMGLSTANMDILASNLVVAFSTTVVGLVIGALCSVISVSRRHWYLRDINAIDQAMALFFVEPGTGGSNNA